MRHDSWNLTGDKGGGDPDGNGHRPAPDEAHTRLAEEFDAWAAAGRAESMETGHMPTAGQALQRIPFDRDRPETFLDLGTGNGYAVRFAADRMHPGGEAVGLDVAPKMVDIAARTTEAWRTAVEAEGRGPFPATRFVEGAFGALPFDDATVDHVFSNEAFYYAPDADAALAEVFRVLKPGGTFHCAIDFYEENPISHDWPEKTGLPMVFDSERGWKARFEKAGFDPVQTVRLLDPEPVPPMTEEQAKHPDWQRNYEHLVKWKNEIGTLLLEGTKPSP